MVTLHALHNIRSEHQDNIVKSGGQESPPHTPPQDITSHPFFFQRNS